MVCCKKIVFSSLGGFIDEMLTFMDESIKNKITYKMIHYSTVSVGNAMI